MLYDFWLHIFFRKRTTPSSSYSPCPEHLKSSLMFVKDEEKIGQACFDIKSIWDSSESESDHMKRILGLPSQFSSSPDVRKLLGQAIKSPWTHREALTVPETERRAE